MKKNPATQIIEAIGGEFFTERLGMTERTLRHARTQGTFAAGRYRDIHLECIAKGVPCPMSAFNWKLADNKFGSGAPKCQDVAAE